MQSNTKKRKYLCPHFLISCMNSSLPSKRDIKIRFALIYGSYFALVFIIWLVVRIAIWYLIPLLVVLAYVGWRNYRINVEILLSAPRMASDDFSSYDGITLTEVGDSGQVRIRGEVWNAQSATPIPRNVKVRVESVDGLVLTVARI